MVQHPHVRDANALEGKVAIVTGAGTGIGRAAAAALHAAGARVALIGRRQELLEETRGLLRGDAAQLHFPVDVTDRQRIMEITGAIEKAWGRIDIVVNSAGTNTPRRSLEEIAPEDWDRVVAVNLTGAYNMTRAALPALRRSRGLIINIGSTSAFRVSKVAGIAYASSKHAIAGFTSAIIVEEKSHGVRATAIHPGEVDTPLLEKRPTPVSAERRRAILRPEDVAEVVAFVATRPPSVVLPEIVIEPAVQDF